MNKKNYLPYVKLTVLLMFVNMLFGYAQKGMAQSVQEWSDPINLSMSGAASNPSMVVDGNWIIHVIWADKFDGFKYTQSADGITWIPPVTVKFPFSPEAPPPVMFRDASGTIHIFWLDDKYKLSYAKTLPDNLDNPASWQTKANLDDTVYDFDAGVDLQGRVHVVYLKNPAPSPGTAGVFYKRSPDGGRTWSSKTLLYESPYFRSLNADNAHIRMDVSDNARNESMLSGMTGLKSGFLLQLPTMAA